MHKKANTLKRKKQSTNQEVLAQSNAIGPARSIIHHPRQTFTRERPHYQRPDVAVIHKLGSPGLPSNDGSLPYQDILEGKDGQILLASNNPLDSQMQHSFQVAGTSDLQATNSSFMSHYTQIQKKNASSKKGQFVAKTSGKISPSFGKAKMAEVGHILSQQSADPFRHKKGGESSGMVLDSKNFIKDESSFPPVVQEREEKYTNESPQIQGRAGKPQNFQQSLKFQFEGVPQDGDSREPATQKLPSAIFKSNNSTIIQKKGQRQTSNPREFIAPGTADLAKRMGPIEGSLILNQPTGHLNSLETKAPPAMAKSMENAKKHAIDERQVPLAMQLKNLSSTINPSGKDDVTEEERDMIFAVSNQPKYPKDTGERAATADQEFKHHRGGQNSTLEGGSFSMKSQAPIISGQSQIVQNSQRNSSINSFGGQCIINISRPEETTAINLGNGMANTNNIVNFNFSNPQTSAFQSINAPSSPKQMNVNIYMTQNQIGDVMPRYPYNGHRVLHYPQQQQQQPDIPGYFPPPQQQQQQPFMSFPQFAQDQAGNMILVSEQNLEDSGFQQRVDYQYPNSQPPQILGNRGVSNLPRYYMMRGNSHSERLRGIMGSQAQTSSGFNASRKNSINKFHKTKVPKTIPNNQADAFRRNGEFMKGKVSNDRNIIQSTPQTMNSYCLDVGAQSTSNSPAPTGQAGGPIYQIVDIRNQKPKRDLDKNELQIQNRSYSSGGGLMGMKQQITHPNQLISLPQGPNVYSHYQKKRGTAQFSTGAKLGGHPVSQPSRDQAQAISQSQAINSNEFPPQIYYNPSNVQQPLIPLKVSTTKEERDFSPHTTQLIQQPSEILPTSTVTKEDRQEQNPVYLSSLKMHHQNGYSPATQLTGSVLNYKKGEFVKLKKRTKGRLNNQKSDKNIDPAATQPQVSGSANFAKFPGAGGGQMNLGKHGRPKSKKNAGNSVQKNPASSKVSQFCSPQQINRGGRSGTAQVVTSQPQKQERRSKLVTENNSELIFMSEDEWMKFLQTNPQLQQNLVTSPQNLLTQQELPQDNLELPQTNKEEMIREGSFGPVRNESSVQQQQQEPQISETFNLSAIQFQNSDVQGTQTLMDTKHVKFKNEGQVKSFRNYDHSGSKSDMKAFKNVRVSTSHGMQHRTDSKHNLHKASSKKLDDRRQDDLMGQMVYMNRQATQKMRGSSSKKHLSFNSKKKQQESLSIGMFKDGTTTSQGEKSGQASVSMALRSSMEKQHRRMGDRNNQADRLSSSPGVRVSNKNLNQDYMFGGAPNNNTSGKFGRRQSDHGGGTAETNPGSALSPLQKASKKEIMYKDPGVKIGNGKLGPVNLIIYKDDLFALKRVPKKQIDKPKRIFHLKCEKNLLLMLKALHNQINAGKYRGLSHFHFHSEDLIPKRESKDLLLQDSIFPTSASKGFQLEENHLVEDVSPPPLPLNYIVSLEETFADSKNVNYIFEYLPGQDLYWVINNQMHMKLGQDSKKQWVKFYGSQILCAMETMQRYNIIYRDIKPENMMIDKEGNIKVIDFGFAKMLHSNNHYRTTTNCGTLGYTAPEVLLGVNSGYSFGVDVWSYGVLLCEMLQGKLPFEEQNDPHQIQKATIQGELKLPRDIDQQTRDLLQCIFNVEPNLRITVKDIMKKSFFKDFDWDKIRNKEIDSDDIPYKPNPNKYRYLLSNQYETQSSLAQPPSASGEVNSATSPKKSFLGDFTIFKVNREFENF